MKTFGVILVVIGLLISIIGLGLSGSGVCFCPAQIAGQASNCPCMNTPQQFTGHIISYLGIPIVGGGAVLFVKGWIKSQSRTVGEK